MHNLGTYLGASQNNCANYNLCILIIDYMHFLYINNRAKEEAE